MTTYNPQRGDLTAGIAGQSADEIGADVVSALNGDIPKPFPTVRTVLQGQTLAALSVVGFNSDGKIVPAEYGVTQAVGVLAHAVDSTSADVEASIWRAGNFNPDVLVWPASYDTDAKKALAFEGAPTPTQIVITKTRTLAV